MQIRPYIYNKTIQAKFTSNCKLCFLEVGLNLRSIKLSWILLKQNSSHQKRYAYVLPLAFCIEPKDGYFEFIPTYLPGKVQQILELVSTDDNYPVIEKILATQVHKYESYCHLYISSIQNILE